AGPGGSSMVRYIGLIDTNDRGHLRRLADWSDRIRAGELPASVPPRPHGVERNLVVTVYDWLSPQYYIHDLIVTDRRHPTVNAFGLIYGAAELSTDDLPILDPVKITKTTMRVPIRDQDAPSSALANPVVQPSPYFGREQVWDSRVNAHNPMMDRDGRVYYTAQVRSPKSPPAYCAAASGHPSAKVYPLTRTPYGIAYSPADSTVWGSNIGHPGWVIRVQPGANPSETALAEVYKVPPPGYGMRGFDVDRRGVAWVTLASGHIASFDRRRCTGRLNGPGAAEGNLCPEGWTFYPIPGPTFAGRDGAAE